MRTTSGHLQRIGLSGVAITILLVGLVAITTVLDTLMVWFLAFSLSWGVELRSAPAGFWALPLLGIGMTAVTIYAARAFRRHQRMRS